MLVVFPTILSFLFSMALLGNLGCRISVLSSANRPANAICPLYVAFVLYIRLDYAQTVSTLFTQESLIIC